jgi:monofunctional biosynthetic peptidoglycan transglycosylase
MNLMVFDFTFSDAVRAWRAIDDGVMGGRSFSQLLSTAHGTARFVGVVSLENNGGFASQRSAAHGLDLSAYEGIVVDCLGDGKTYKLALRTDGGFDGVAYQAEFQATAHEWRHVMTPWTDFRPTFRGRVLTGHAPLDPSRITQFGLMIADRQAGNFCLELKRIAAYRLKAQTDV